MPGRWSEDFEELGDDVDKMAEFFAESATGRISGAGQDPHTGEFLSPDGFEPKQRIANGIGRAMQERQTGIVDQARSKAERYVPDESAATIKYRQKRWNDHRLYSTDELVRYHEFGTSTRADDQSRATINAPDRNGYVIPLDGYDSFPFGPRQVAGMDELTFKFVVHPGVEAQHFMREAVEEGSFKIQEEIADQFDQIEMDI